MYCQKCGREISDAAKFCDGCGSPVSMDRPQEDFSPRLQSDHIIVECMPHWAHYQINFIGGWILCALSLITMFASLLLGVVLLIIAVINIIAGIIKKRSSVLRLTETTVYGRTGLISTREMSSPISKIQNVTITSTLPGRIFKYNTVTILTAGTDSAEYIYKNVTNANEFRDQLFARTK